MTFMGQLLREFMVKLLDRSTSERSHTHTASLCARLDYNGYYSTALDLPKTS
jgi:hypothetical protein